jgi:glucosyl-3-phosphoglycerate phosphatase
MLLIRHGQSEFNVVFSVTRRDPGIRDPRLTEEGRRQALAVARALADEEVMRLIASPYTRALETAEIIAEQLDLPITVDARIGERAAYACDIGTPTPALRGRWPKLALDHLDEVWWPALEESETTLGHRCEIVRREIAALPDWRNLALVTHWGFIRGLTGMNVANCAILRMDPARPGESAVPLPVPPHSDDAAPRPASD